MDLLEVKHLKKYYATHKAVDDVSFGIPRGTICGLLGPNGAGKTTLLRMITGIFYPDEGQIIFDGKPFNLLADPMRIGYMPEERGLYKKMKLAEQLLYLGQLKGLDERPAKERIRFWLKKMDLDNWANRKLGDLSKGMQQKVQFIATILHEPALLILDEPFSGLDPINSNMLKDEIFHLKEKGTTIIFSTHRMEQVEEICNHIVLINLGKKILDGPVDSIRQQYKEHLFRIQYPGPALPVEGQPEEFEIERQEEGEVIVRLRDGKTTNQILQYFITRGIPVIGFNEVLPSINEIFIRRVREASLKVPSLAV